MSISHSLEEYQYELPEARIAKRPLDKREDSKLLIYKNGEVSHGVFKDIVDQIPASTTVFMNNTRVISARLYFRRSTGAVIEVFLTNPVSPFSDIQQALSVKGSCTWACIIGNLKKWKDGERLVIMLSSGATLSAELTDRQKGVVTFHWDSDQIFSEIIEQIGHTPLPPYMNRPDDSEDKDRYQTVFSEFEGAVAAPTAGLHFTEKILKEMREKGIHTDKLTLHVSAGTFKPIKVIDYRNHDMHNEQIIVTRKNIENLLTSKGPVMAIGTTSMRTLESLFWYGALLCSEPNADFFIDQNMPYRDGLKQIDKSAALSALLDKMNSQRTDVLIGQTEIFLFPGYQFRLVDVLSTNFHMPGSTLILLVAAFIGEDWNKVYQEALEKDYRFLSYGDTSLLFKATH